MKEKKADNRIRTGDLFITSESLYQLSHIGLCFGFVRNALRYYSDSPGIMSREDLTMNKKIDLSGNMLKIIACITMLIDHIGASLIGTWMVQIEDITLYAQVYNLYMGMRIIGRLAFPIYIFLLVEGFYYTHSRKNYLIRLTVFMILSDVPFDMALYLSNESIAAGQFYALYAQNVYFTLVIGFLGMLLAELIIDTFAERWKRVLLNIAVMLLCMFLAEQLCTDYGMAGIAAIFAAYYLRDYSKELEMAVIVLMLTALSSATEIWALIDVVLVFFYHGNRGKKQMNKWFFYAFYPVHLLILAILKMVIF